MTASATCAGDSEAPWLDDTELAAWKNLVHLLMLLPTAVDRRLREDAGIPLAHYQTLAILSGEPERSMRMTQLARVVGSTTSRLSHAIAALEQRGWVERRMCPEDKRGQVATLTDLGFATLAAAAPGHAADVRRLVFDHLDPDQVLQLRDLTAALLPGLAHEVTPG